MDLEILTGQAAGKVTQVNLYVPDITNRGAVFHYQRKTNGFKGPEFQAALAALGEAPTLDELLAGIADFLIGRTVVAELSIQKGGQYDGQNQLDKTSPLGESAAVAPASAPAPAPSPTPVAEVAPAQEVAPF
jgi:hypothetical protein